MASSADLLAPLAPVLSRLGPADVADVMRVGNSAFFLMGYSTSYWLEILSHRSSVIVIGCRDGPTDELVAKHARAHVPAEERVGPLNALLHHRKCAIVRSLAVLRGYRRLGVASLLLEVASNALRMMPKPPTLLLCRVSEYNGETVPCLEYNGFTVYVEVPSQACGMDRVYSRPI